MKIVEKLDSHGKEFLTRQSLESEYASVDEPSDSNGNTLLNIDKLEAMISYLAKRMTNFFKVKLMKSLWYADVLSYNATGKAMTGLVYRHENYGALPVGHYSIMCLENVNVNEEILRNGYLKVHVYAKER